MTIESMLIENKKRLDELSKPYDPITGEGSAIPRRFLGFKYNHHWIKWYLPLPMFDLAQVKMLLSLRSVEKLLEKTMGKSSKAMEQAWFYSFTLTRTEYDFEFWAATSYWITDKRTGKDILFKLNYPQREILWPEIYSQLISGKAIRVNVVKARQWGGSTEIDAVIFYIQNVLKNDAKWNSAIVGSDETQAKTIRNMYRVAADNYPPAYGSVTLVPFEKTKNIQIKETGAVISVGSMEKPEAIRSQNLKCVHSTEVASWKKTASKEPKDLIQTLHGSLTNEPYTFAAYESTAKGVGNFFHETWLNSVSGKSAYKPVFVPWFKIELYMMDYKEFYDSTQEFVSTWDEYEWWLWQQGATIEGIYWYRWKLDGEMEGDTWRMKSEFPTTANEAFQATGRPVFHPAYLEGLDFLTQVPFVRGMLEATASKTKSAFDKLKFVEQVNGLIKVWVKPVPFEKDPVLNRYLVSLDIGGAHRDADKSIISVYDRIWMLDGDGEIEVVASAEFNMDQDLTVWLAVQVAYWYNKAMFFPEFNSLDSEADTEGNHFYTVLDEIVPYYENIYQRTSVEDIKNGVPAKYGFHTNKATKTMVIDNFKAILREKKLIEREPEAIAQYRAYEHQDSNKMGGAGTNHDDYVMSRAIGAWGATKFMELPKRIVIDKDRVAKKWADHRITGEATI